MKIDRIDGYKIRITSKKPLHCFYTHETNGVLITEKKVKRVKIEVDKA